MLCQLLQDPVLYFRMLADEVPVFPRLSLMTMQEAGVHVVALHQLSVPRVRRVRHVANALAEDSLQHPGLGTSSTARDAYM